MVQKVPKWARAEPPADPTEERHNKESLVEGQTAVAPISLVFSLLSKQGINYYPGRFAKLLLEGLGVCVWGDKEG